jgi:Phospholipase_D-nuclease N-terminal
METTDVFSIIKQYLPLLIPVVLIELGLLVTALVDLIRRPQTRGPKWLWAIVIVLVNIIGPIVYFIAGRKEE